MINLFSFNIEKLNKLKLRKQLIIQNIALTKNRLNNNKFSYIKIIKWMNFYKKILLFFSQKIGDIFIYSILIYSVFFIFIEIYDIKINSNFLKILIIFSVFSLVLKISKNIFILWFSGFLYIIFFIFLNINF